MGGTGRRAGGRIQALKDSVLQVWLFIISFLGTSRGKVDIDVVCMTALHIKCDIDVRDRPLPINKVP